MFRSKVACFFCGEHSAPGTSTRYHPNGAVKTFTCLSCRADNHLDRNGEIIDHVPAASNPVQYARPVRGSRVRSASPPSPTFCRQCQQNQLIVTTAKADFVLPPEDHPDYDYTARVLLPKHIAELEARWPPVCATCGPKVSKRIRKSNYEAKVASLGHMRARTDRVRGAGRSAWEAKRVLSTLLWLVRGAVWCGGHVAFLAWHGSRMMSPRESWGMEEPTWRRCVQQSMKLGEMDAVCADVAAAFVGRWAWVSLIGFNWMYREWQLENHPEKKLVGAWEYIRLEMATIVIRFAGWYLLGPGGVNFTEDAAQRIHIAFFLITLMATLYSVTCLKLEKPQLISLKETTSLPGTPETLSPPDSPRRAARPRPAQSQLRNQIPRPESPPRMHPIRSTQPIPPIQPAYRENGSAFERTLSPPSARQRPQPQRSASQDDAMDWNPTTQLQIAQPAPTPATSFSSWSSSTSPFGQLAQQAQQPQRTSFSSFGSSSFPAPQAPRSQHPNIFTNPRPAAPIAHSPATSTSTDAFRRLQDPRFKPLPEPKFRGLPDTSLDNEFENMFSKGLTFSDPADDNIPPSSVTEREGLTLQLLRASIVATAAALATVGRGEWWMVATAMAGILAVAGWRIVLAGGLMDPGTLASAGGALAVAGLAAAGVLSVGVQTKLAVLVLLISGGLEVAGVLGRMERARSRRYHREELEEQRRRRGAAGGRDESPLRMFGGR
ncbi:Ima1 N-terminal domain-containing protein [Geopyxis carbonaria]|nr:Ima1 N-terminal domain-containing protein [Geopyxis carbonaria]